MIYCAQQTLAISCGKWGLALPRKPGKHTPYFELVEAQEQAGCPICRLVHKATDRYLDSILYEAVLDPDVRGKLRESYGFCREHVGMLRGKPGRALGIALIYRDIIRAIAKTPEAARRGTSRSLLRRLLGRAQRPVVDGDVAVDWRCPACKIGRDAEDSYLDLLVAHLDDERLHAAYARGEGLCLSHLVGALGRVTDEESLQRLAGPQVARYRQMICDLDAFIRKRDHRYREEKYGDEGDVWLRAMNATVGGAGMGLSAKEGGR